MRLLRTLLVALVATLALAGCQLLAGGAATPAPTAAELLGRTPAPVVLPAGWRGGTVDVDDLPAEAIDTLLLISVGGPFPYDQDGATFQNREGVLPTHPRGYYHEYTVETPGSADRGARRIVTGDDGERFYTDDHYESFRFVLGEPGG